MATAPTLHVTVWLHKGFLAGQVAPAEFAGGGFGVTFALGPVGESIHIVFGGLAVPLDEQQAAARKAADVFTGIADRLAAIEADGDQLADRDLNSDTSDDTGQVR